MKDEREQRGLNTILSSGGREAGCNESFQAWCSESQEGIFQKIQIPEPNVKVMNQTLQR